MALTWRRCSSCKRDIPCRSEYYVCSVSTCRQKKTNYAFCSVECWDTHIPLERHRPDSVSALGRRAPDQPEAATGDEPRKRIVVSAPSASAAPVVRSGSADESEILVVVSKLKKYISDRSGMNTSASTMDALSDRIRRICDRAIENARADGRKTVMDRDVP